MSLAKDRLIALMQYADGELDGEENEAARAEIVASLATDAEARAFLDEMERLSDVTRAAEELALPDTSKFDVADAVMDLVDDYEQKNAVTTRLEREPAAAPVGAVPGGAAVSSLDVARERRRRVGVVVLTGLALAAGVALVMRSHPSEDMTTATATHLGKPVDSVPALTGSGGAPAVPSSSEAALAAANAANNQDSDRQGVEVNMSDSTQTGVSVFYLPGSDGTSASAVVWIDESSGGNK